jgi:hypothetical protein
MPQVRPPRCGGQSLSGPGATSPVPLVAVGTGRIRRHCRRRSTLQMAAACEICSILWRCSHPNQHSHPSSVRTRRGLEKKSAFPSRPRCALHNCPFVQASAAKYNRPIVSDGDAELEVPTQPSVVWPTTITPTNRIQLFQMRIGHLLSTWQTNRILTSLTTTAQRGRHSINLCEFGRLQSQPQPWT